MQSRMEKIDPSTRAQSKMGMNLSQGVHSQSRVASRAQSKLGMIASQIGKAGQTGKGKGGKIGGITEEEVICCCSDIVLLFNLLHIVVEMFFKLFVKCFYAFLKGTKVGFCFWTTFFYSLHFWHCTCEAQVQYCEFTAISHKYDLATLSHKCDFYCKKSPLWFFC